MAHEIYSTACGSAAVQEKISLGEIIEFPLPEPLNILPPLEKLHKEQACHKPADVREPCHPAAAHVGVKKTQSARQLGKKPKSQNKQSGNSKGRETDENRHQNQNPRARKFQQISAEHAANRAAGADHRQRGVRLDGDV